VLYFLKNVVTAFVVSALAGTDLLGSLSAVLLLLEAVLHVLQNCGSRGHNNYSTVKVFAETYVAWVAVRWYRCLKALKLNGF